MITSLTASQEMAEACKRLIKNCIICWNYLYLSQELEEIEDAASRQVFLDAVAHGSVISWQHIIHWPAKHCTATTVNRPSGFSGLDLSAVRQ